jgi:hypothetical protein
MAAAQQRRTDWQRNADEFVDATAAWIADGQALGIIQIQMPAVAAAVPQRYFATTVVSTKGIIAANCDS